MTQEELALIKEVLLDASQLFAYYAKNLTSWQNKNEKALRIITTELLRRRQTP